MAPVDGAAGCSRDDEARVRTGPICFIVPARVMRISDCVFSFFLGMKYYTAMSSFSIKDLVRIEL